MREAPLAFFTEKDKKQYQYIDLIAFEISYVYMADVSSNSNTTTFGVSEDIRIILNASGYDFTESGLGYCWILSFEDGPNVGALRKVSAYDSTFGFFTVDEPVDYNPDEGRMRISKMIFLTSRNTPVNFYIPDDSYGEDVAVSYQPFPMTIKPIGTNSKDEIMTLDVTLASANRLIGDAIQTAEGLQGNKVIHLRTFDNVLDQGKEYCMKDISYVDSVSITNTEVKFELETKFNIVDVTVPRRIYTRDFCGFMLGDESCTWVSGETGLGPGVGFGGVLNADGDVVFSYPNASTITCDHTLNGPNGCKAHNNNERFGGFPTIVNM